MHISRKAVAAIGLVAMVGTILATTQATGVAAPDREILLQSQMSGDQVVQETGGDPDGTGFATILVDSKDGVACFDVDVENVATPITGRIQSGSAGAIGPPVVFLFENREPPVRECVTADRKTVREIGRDPESYYLNIVNDEFPIGAVRGQLEFATQ
jgi:hypothetical protein